MATFRKNGDKWRAEVRIRGRRASKSFPSKTEARAWAIEKEKEFGRGGDILRGKTLDDAFKKYALRYLPPKKGRAGKSSGWISWDGIRWPRCRCATCRRKI